MRTHNYEEKRSAWKLTILSLLFGAVPLIILICISFPKDLWTPVRGIEFFRVFLTVILISCVSSATIGLSTSLEDSEVRGHTGNSPIINPLSGLISAIAGFGHIACLVLVIRYIFLMIGDRFGLQSRLHALPDTVWNTLFSGLPWTLGVLIGLVILAWTVIHLIRKCLLQSSKFDILVSVSMAIAFFTIMIEGLVFLWLWGYLNNRFPVGSPMRTLFPLLWLVQWPAAAYIMVGTFFLVMPNPRKNEK